MPSYHNSIVRSECSQFLFAIGTSLSTDMGKCIFHRIYTTATMIGDSLVLPFSCLIHQLVQLTKPRAFPNEQDLKLKSLTKTNYRVQSHSVPTPQASSLEPEDLQGFGFKKSSWQYMFFQATPGATSSKP